jgi:hypothetical protein
MLTRTQGSSVGALSVADLAARASGDPGAPPIGTDLPAPAPRRSIAAKLEMLAARYEQVS